ncbi:LysR family transcriptional regulator [Hydrogenophaga sp. BPS33]|uniref:LysR family transcriptional regulator n=1 Tax=Hydrogenophaga sp. BPS33 TaxID=2651974 RepID=UPI00131F6F82|nr:LysR family transcriptional regulator [Hydrogenophaga sp. BPS33]QHE89316.1 LysR family transcriptional regulator [Hydrogenophaga sp. BPS33]
MLDLNLLLVLEALLQHQNVTAAAAHLGLTQSATSNALGRLRRHFDDPMFVSTYNGMLPTARTMEISESLSQALQLIRSMDAPRQVFDPCRSTRTFRFHLSDVGEVVFLPMLIRRLDELGASVKVETAQMTADEVGTRLESGEIDVAVGFLPALSKKLEHLTLFKEHYVCVMRKSHPLANAGKLTLKKFLGGAHVLIESMGSGHRIIERTLEQHGIPRGVALRVPHFMVVPMIVSESDRIVTVPSRVARVFSSVMDIRVQDLPIDIPSFDVSLYWHPRFGSDPGVLWLLSLMSELFSEPKGRPMQKANPLDAY